MIPAISIVMPVYNVPELFLKQCFDAVLAQTFTDFELIVVNDASTEKYCQKVIEFFKEKDNRITIINHQKNKGLAGARNSGIDYATGKYLIFIDSDDLWVSNFLEVLFSHAEKIQSDILCFESNRFDEVENINSFLKEKTPLKTHYPIRATQKSTVTAWSKLYLRECVQNLRFAESVRKSEDIPYFLESFNLANRIFTIPFKGYFYRRNPNSIMSSYKTTQGIINLIPFVEYMLSIRTLFVTKPKIAKLYTYCFSLRLFSSLKYINAKSVPITDRQMIWNLYYDLIKNNKDAFKVAFPWYIPVFSLSFIKSYSILIHVYFIVLRTLAIFLK